MREVEKIAKSTKATASIMVRLCAILSLSRKEKVEIASTIDA